MSLTAGALCGKHPQVTAVEVCTRCGSFLCGECVDYLDDTTAYCAPCLGLVSAKVSLRAKGSLVLSAGGVVGMLLGLVVRGRSGLALWGVAIPTGFVGLALAIQELRSITRHEASAAGRSIASFARWVGVVHTALVLALVAAFVLFVTRLGARDP